MPKATELKATIWFGTSIFTIIVILLFIISVYFGANPLNHNQLLRHKIVSIFPQGWAFFTRSSTEPRVYGYLFNSKSKDFEELDQRSISFDNSFGLDRSNRLLNAELMYYVREALNVNNKLIIHKRSPKIEDFIDSPLKISYITLRYKHSETPFLHAGQYLIIIQKMLPWPLLSKKPDYPSDYVIIPVDLKS